ncbi:MAG: hypothetical protein HQL47_05495 [Gammaproteobacteria bacterium]|nr:hypothetical protein [Gammaproteobacteria bacterium]
MSREGPSLEHLLRRLTETPSLFLDEPLIRKRGKVDLAAVASDLLLAIGGTLPTLKEANAFQPAKLAERNPARLLLIACWLLHDDWFVQRAELLGPIKTLLAEGLHELGNLIDAELFVTDPERREELVRLVLDALQLRPAGESPNQAADRLKSLDSLERERVIRASRARAEAERARKLRAEMEAREAREAAAKANREW